MTPEPLAEDLTWLKNFEQRIIHARAQLEGALKKEIDWTIRSFNDLGKLTGIDIAQKVKSRSIQETGSLATLYVLEKERFNPNREIYSLRTISAFMCTADYQKYLLTPGQAAAIKNRGISDSRGVIPPGIYLVQEKIFYPDEEDLKKAEKLQARCIYDWSTAQPLSAYVPELNQEKIIKALLSNISSTL